MRTVRETTARWVQQIRRAGAWRLVYEIGLVLIVTITSAWVAADTAWYPAAPWLTALTTPVLMLTRLRFPVITYVAAAVIGLGTGGQNSLLLIVLSASLAYRVVTFWQVVAALAAGLPCFVLAVLWEEPLSGEWIIFATMLYAFLALLPAGVARLVRRRRTLLTAMHRRNVQLHSEQDEIARGAQTRERARIARDLHDSLGHKLTLISLYAGMVRTAEDEQQRTETADLVRQTSSAAMTELRQILGILAHDGDTQSSVRPLTGLDELAAQARATGADVQVVREGEPRPLAALTEHAAYRVLQEGLTNALRHAHGGRIVVLLRYEADALVARVTNTAGQRVVRATSGQGLLGLTERVRVAGGMLFHGPDGDGGFRLAATLPYPGDATAPPPAAPAAAVPAGPDFASVLDKHSRRSRAVLAGTALSLVVLVALCLAGAWVMVSGVAMDRETYDAVRVGQSEAQVRALLPDPDVAVTGTTGGRPVPGAQCIDYRIAIPDMLRSATNETIYRFCFRDGTLADKQIIEEQTP